MASDKDKKILVIASGESAQRKHFHDQITQHFAIDLVFTANDGTTAMSRIQNVPPHVVLADVGLPKMNGIDLVEAYLGKKAFASTAFILVGQLPKKAVLVDELVTGRVQFLQNPKDDGELAKCVAKALNFAFHGKNTSYSVRFLTEGEQLIKEGDPGASVYIVKKGHLRAYRMVAAKEVELGKIRPGEFVGEMAYINNEPRAANVTAITHCELIEVPIGTLDQILFRRPAWCKSLLQTLARRLKQVNETRS